VMPPAARAVTTGPRHHFFGFHDLVQWNAKGDLLLGLEVDGISRPPYPGEQARSGIICPESREFIPIHETCAFNYPQGARQQWIGDKVYQRAHGFSGPTTRVPYHSDLRRYSPLGVCRPHLRSYDSWFLEHSSNERPSPTLSVYCPA
jgi:hypothetical protein